ncbi:NAD(P)/FAD-dependent oxidoreductase [Limimaricola sp. AA108-03]|uniref:NAD(P)/FAD-dependent oxidoreductase n=1 Tax=Limimaricola sp. AA108-03 TaxID=3425945 RepID=UPI003D76E508
MTAAARSIHRRPPPDTPSGWVSRAEIMQMGTAETPDGVDWAVIGAGFTGLAAARRLAELNPGAQIALIDAKPVGWGSSGRNAGFVIDLPHKFDLEHDDPERLRRVVRLNTAARDDLDRLVRDHGIDCDWSPAGKLQAAIGASGSANMAVFARALDSIEQGYEMLDRAQVAAITGTAHYAGAIFTPGCMLMNPVRLVRGLASALPGNVALLDATPVTRIERRGGFALHLARPEGARVLKAGRIVAAMNAFTPEFGWLRNRVVPVATFASLTRPLSDAELANYGGRLDWGLTPADPGGTTLRMTRDRRLLVRNQYDYLGDYGASPRALDKVRRSHRLALARRFPALAEIPFESTWGGVCALTRNHVSYFGEMEPGVWGSSCHNGVGVARGTISGRLLAEAAHGQDSDLLSDMIAVSDMPVRNPPRPFVGYGVKARLRLAAWEARKEI